MGFRLTVTHLDRLPLCGGDTRSLATHLVESTDECPLPLLVFRQAASSVAASRQDVYALELHAYTSVAG